MGVAIAWKKMGGGGGGVWVAGVKLSHHNVNIKEN